MPQHNDIEENVINFIGLVFGEGVTKGKLMLSVPGGPELVSRDVDEVITFVESNPEVECRLGTAENEWVGVVVDLQDDEDQTSFSLEPTFVIAKDGTRLALWLFENVPSEDQLDSLARKQNKFQCPQTVFIPNVHGAKVIFQSGEEPLFYTVSGIIGNLQLKASEHKEESHEHGRLIIDDLDDTVLSKPVCVGMSKDGSKTRPGKWKNWDTRFGDVVAQLSKHTPGKKDGPCILQGEVIDGERRAKAIRANYMIGLDLDTGEDAATIDARIRELGLFAVRYSTHSHLKSVSEFNRDSVMKRMKLDGEPKEADMRRFLSEVKGYKPHIIKNLELLEDVHGADGVKVRVKHKPMQKYRLIFPLSMPFIFAERGVSHSAAIEEWKERMGGLAEVLRVHLDESCVDPSRLYYLPRHPDGTDNYELAIINGKPLDIEDLPRVGVGRKKRSLDPFEQAATALTGEDKSLKTPQGTSLKRWAMARALGFEIREVLNDHAPEKVREVCATHDGVHIECPFDGEHSNPGDPEDQGTFVINGSEAENEGFRVHCMHDACSGRDRLDFLLEMIEQDWFDESILFNDDYAAVVVDEDSDDEEVEKVQKVGKEEKGFAAIRRRVGEFNKETTEDEIDLVLKLLAETEASEVKAARVIKSICDATGEGKTIIDKGYREHKKEVSTRNKKDKRKKAASSETSGGKPVIFPDEVGFQAAVHAAWKAIKKKNAEDPLLFRYATGIARLREDEYGAMVAEELGQAQMRHEVNKVTIWKESRGELPPKEVSAPQDIISDMVSMAGHPLPVLRGIISTPVFTADEEILFDTGYDPKSGLYLHMPEDIIVPDVPEVPSQADIDKARDLIVTEVLCDFPFDGRDGGNASKAHGVCMMLQPFIREMIDGATPIYFVDKPTAGTGAGLFVDAALLVSTGDKGVAQTEAKTEDEIRKTISSSLFEGVPYFWLDNINFKVESSAIASATTSSKWTDRVLGSTKKITVPVRCMWIFSGNNVQVSNEIARRMVRVRLDSKLADPASRKNFRHGDLARWIRENRGDIIWACLTLTSAWLAEGKPRGDKVLASYENWSHTMGGILKVAGIDGFLGNMKELREESDEEGSALNDFIAAWWAEFKDTDVPIGDPEGGDGLLGVVDDNEIALPVRAGSPQGRKISLGKLIGKMRGRRFDLDTEDGEITVKVGSKPSKATGAKKCWVLETVEPVT